MFELKYMMKYINKQEGFTLVELLIVVAIIAVLATVGFTVFSGAQKKAQDSTYKSQTHEIAQAEEKYRNDNPATDVYVAQGSLGPYLSSGSFPANFSVTLNATSTSFCAVSPALNNITSGNCSGSGAGVCTWAANSTRWCVSSRQ